MNVSLLVAIKYVRKREREAAGQRNVQSSLQSRSSAWRRYQYLSMLPIRARRLSGLYVPSNGLNTSKGELARAALREAGVEARFLQPSIQRRRWFRARKAVRLIVRLPVALMIRAGLGRRVRFAQEEIGIILATIICQRMLRRNKLLVPIINSDLSPSQVILACAAQAEMRPSVWWQDDFHYTEPVPFKVEAGVVLNRNGLGALLARNPSAMVFKRCISNSLAEKSDNTGIRIPTKVQRIGVAVNGLFTGTDAELKMLALIRKVFSDVKIELRLHPTAKSVPHLDELGVDASPRAESVEGFSERMDVVFSGNSAIQYKMLLTGAPVIHLADLDPLEFDLYGYVSGELVYGAPLLTTETLAEALEFYRSPAFRQRILTHEAHQFDIPGKPLSQIVELISGAGC